MGQIIQLRVQRKEVFLKKPVIATLGTAKSIINHRSLGFYAGKKVRIIGYYDNPGGRCCIIENGERTWRAKVLINFFPGIDLKSPEFAELTHD